MVAGSTSRRPALKRRPDRDRALANDTSLVLAQDRGDERSEGRDRALDESGKGYDSRSEREQRHGDADQDGECEKVPAWEGDRFGSAGRGETLRCREYTHRGRRSLSTHDRAAVRRHIPLRGEFHASSE